MSGCSTCSNSVTCTACSIGRPIPGGCSVIPGCAQVVQIPYQISTCVLCRFP